MLYLEYGKKKPSDINLLTRQIVEETIGEPLLPDKPAKESKPIKEKNPAAVALGRLGGLRGGKARANKLTSEQKKEIAQKAAKTRWGSKK